MLRTPFSRDTTKINREILCEIVNLFVIRERRARLLEFLASPKRYKDFVHELLNDPRSLDPKTVIELPGSEHFIEPILVRLRRMGAGREAYCFSETEMDGQIGTLEEILEKVVGQGRGDIIFCIGTQLAYYEDHENERYILSASK
jgi:hypothetical protein